MPKVSVVIPSYQLGHMVRQAVASVLMQTEEDLECIVVDDGSTDDTATVLSTIKDPRFTYIKQMNQGVSAARNAGLNHATGEYIAFLDADDLWRPRYLERQLEILEAEPNVGLCFSDFIRSDHEFGVLPDTYMDFFLPELWQTKHRPTVCNGYVIEGDAFSALVPFRLYPYSVGVTVIRREVVEGKKQIRFPVGMRFGEDRVFLLKCYMRTQAAFIPEPLAEVRRHPSNISKSSPGSQEVFILPSLLGEPLTHVQRRALLKRISQAHCGMGYQARKRKDRASAARFYMQALRYPGRRIAALTRLMALPITPI